jgi:hypothetical protein
MLSIQTEAMASSFRQQCCFFRVFGLSDSLAEAEPVTYIGLFISETIRLAVTKLGRAPAQI